MPGCVLVARPRPARAQDGASRADDLGLHEQVAERRVQRIGGRGGEHDLGVADDLDPARGASPRFVMRTRRSSTSSSGDTTISVCVSKSLVAPAELDARFGEARLERVGRGPRGQERRRPDATARRIAQVAERAPRIAGGVLAPARDRDVVPPAVAAAGVRDHDVIAAVGQELHRRDRRMRRGEHAHRRFGRVRRGRRSTSSGLLAYDARALGTRSCRSSSVALEMRVGDEAPLHRLVEQQVREREQRHALVMRHERADDRRSSRRGGARDGVKSMAS